MLDFTKSPINEVNFEDFIQTIKQLLADFINFIHCYYYLKGFKWHFKQDNFIHEPPLLLLHRFHIFLLIWHQYLSNNLEWCESTFSKRVLLLISNHSKVRLRCCTGINKFRFLLFKIDQIFPHIIHLLIFSSKFSLCLQDHHL